MHRHCRNVVVLILAMTAVGCADFVLDGTTGRRQPDPDGRVIVIVGDGATPQTDAGAPPQADTGTTPPADTGAATPDSFVPPPQSDLGPKPDTQPPPVGQCGNAYETEVLQLVNAERAKLGKAPLECALDAGAVARNYSKYMCEARFFSHTGQDGSSPWSRLQDAGVTFKSAGENIAAGQKNPASVMNSWMNSSGHRANILGNYTHLGTGYHACSGGKYPSYWTQNFLRR
jgi:uncharacterized protein YkwD